MKKKSLLAAAGLALAGAAVITSVQAESGPAPDKQELKRQILELARSSAPEGAEVMISTVGGDPELMREIVDEIAQEQAASKKEVPVVNVEDAWTADE